MQATVVIPKETANLICSFTSDEEVAFAMCVPAFSELASLMGYESVDIISENEIRDGATLIYDGTDGDRARFSKDELELSLGIGGVKLKYRGEIVAGSEFESYYIDEMWAQLLWDLRDICSLCHEKPSLPMELPRIIEEASCGYVKANDEILSMAKHSSKFSDPRFGPLGALSMDDAIYLGNSSIATAAQNMKRISNVWNNAVGKHKLNRPHARGLREMAQAGGIPPMIAALFSGVPVEDIIS